MEPEQVPIEQLIGKRVAFREGEEHAACWHQQVGLVAGLVLRKARTLAQKAEMIADELEVPPELLNQELEVPRVWVRADPCPKMPRGCETAVEPGCLRRLPKEAS